jgi:hypothetical protein
MRLSMPSPPTAAVLLLSLFLWACSPLQLQVEPAPEFSGAGYRTVAWASAPLGERSRSDMRRFDGAVRAAAEEQLQARGYQLTSVPDEADLLLDYRTSVRVEAAGAGAVSPADEVARSWDLDPTPAGDSAIHRHPVALEQQRGELFLSLRDRRSGELAWQGRAAGMSRAGDPSEARALARRAVGELLRQLPIVTP